jgi:hypothetical protein
MSTDTNNVIASANGGSQIQNFIADYAREACAIAFAGTEFVIGTPVLNERAETEGWVVNEFVRVPITVVGGMEGRSLSLVFMVGTVKGPSHPFAGNSFQVYGPTVEGLESGNVLVKFEKGQGYGAWEVEEGLNAEVFLRHYNRVGGIALAVWDFVRNQGKKFLSGTLVFGMSKSEIIRCATRAIRASGIRLPWNAASWGPTMGHYNEAVKLDVEATELAMRFPSWLLQLTAPRFARLRSVVEKCSAAGMNSPLTTINIWSLVEKFTTPAEASAALAKLEAAAQHLLAAHGLRPMISALGENLARLDEAAPQRVADATLTQVAKQKTSAAQ